MEFIYDNTGVVGVKYNDTLYFYRKDAQGNIIAILNSDGAVVARYEYDAWGNHTVTEEEEYLSLANANPFRYRSYYFDTETGLYYLKSRYYDPELGRFISQDSMEYADPETINGLNLYAYCGNNPVMYVDPTGRIFLSLLIAGFIGAVAAAIGSIGVQYLTTGEINWSQVGISALFGAVSGILAFTGFGEAIGQFIIQGTLAVGELYSIAAYNGTVDSVGFAEVVATFLFAGALGTIGSGNAAKEFTRIGQIEGSFIKYSLRDIIKGGESIFSTVLNRGVKYFKDFIKPFITQSFVIMGITAFANIVDYWFQQIYDYFI